MTVTDPPGDPAHTAVPGSPAETDWSWVAADPHWIPPEIDLGRPSAARMSNVALGGKDNFAVDRAAVDEITAVVPGYAALARANREFMVRAVQAMARDGIDQFMDLGTGIPASPSVHEVAQQVHRHARVVYIDNDPAVMVQNRALRGTYDGVLTASHDLRQPEVLLGDDVVREGLDFTRPIGLVLTSVLHFVGTDVAPPMLDHYRRAVVPGSQLAVSLACQEGTAADVQATMEAVYRRSATPIVFRSRSQIEQLLDGWELSGPGLADVTGWDARTEPSTLVLLAGLGRRL